MAVEFGQVQLKDSQGSTVASRSSVPVVTNLNHNASTPYPFALTKPSLTSAVQKPIPLQAGLTGKNVGELSNDSLYIVQPAGALRLDDGSAERAYGVSQGNAPQLAQKFHFLQADSLRGVDLPFFVPAGFDWTGMTFQLGIWAVDTAGLPGDVLYLSDSAYSPALPYAV